MNWLKRTLGRALTCCGNYLLGWGEQAGESGQDKPSPFLDPWVAVVWADKWLEIAGQRLVFAKLAEERYERRKSRPWPYFQGPDFIMVPKIASLCDD